MPGYFAMRPFIHFILVSFAVALAGCEPDAYETEELDEFDRLELGVAQPDDITTPPVPDGVAMVDLDLVDESDVEPSPRAMFNQLIWASPGYAALFVAWGGTQDAAHCTKSQNLFNYAHQVCAYIKGRFIDGTMKTPCYYEGSGQYRFFEFWCGP